MLMNTDIYASLSYPERQSILMDAEKERSHEIQQ